eukprot:COSAG01_NODE_4660_length_4842_cov_22.777567_6_plen_52_part_00
MSVVALRMSKMPHHEMSKQWLAPWRADSGYDSRWDPHAPVECPELTDIFLD